MVSHTSDSPDFEPETYTEVRQELELKKRNLGLNVRKVKEQYVEVLRLEDKLDHFHESKLCPSCFVAGCREHCNACGGKILFSKSDKVLMNKTNGKICILNPDGTEHRLCSVKPPYGIPELDEEWLVQYKAQDVKQIAGTRVWVDRQQYYDKRHP